MLIRNPVHVKFIPNWPKMLNSYTHFALKSTISSSFVVQADFNRDPFIREFGLEVSQCMMETMGRVLNPPKLEYGGRNSRTFTGK
jgi:hypothetical protein